MHTYVCIHTHTHTHTAPEKNCCYIQWIDFYSFSSLPSFSSSLFLSPSLFFFFYLLHGFRAISPSRWWRHSGVRKLTSWHTGRQRMPVLCASSFPLLIPTSSPAYRIVLTTFMAGLSPLVNGLWKHHYWHTQRCALLIS
jgi:hypothetical protein